MCSDTGSGRGSLFQSPKFVCYTCLRLGGCGFCRIVMPKRDIRTRSSLFLRSFLFQPNVGYLFIQQALVVEYFN
ncbi:hypothetical protein TSAR_001621 [Trichomalopsis sarcophagae]|uniref:Uncharacterized protein n=1 Tax=Trichomalopsis sarcophagae TaxID=543379 RepID=A0A232EZD0_9HYME|nr:hypothetical protein TSAR_001621 [Trichomalopsis sarcophagae]